MNLRMEKARSLLKNTDMQINAIANSVGYVDQLDFFQNIQTALWNEPESLTERKKKNW